MTAKIQHKSERKFKNTAWLLFSITAIQATTLTAAPQLTCENPVYDFGSIENTQTMTNTFILVNTGDEPVIIHTIKPNCGCTVAEISTQHIEPGKKTTLTSTLDLTNLDGEQRKTILIESNDPETPRLVLTMQGEAIDLICPAPRNLFAIRLKPGSEWRKEIILTAKGTEPLAIQSVETGHTRLIAAVRDGSSEQQKVVEIQLDTTFPEPTIDGKIIIHTNSKKRPTVEIPYRFSTSEAPFKLPRPVQH